jgi:hypothetical protein
MVSARRRHAGRRGRRRRSGCQRLHRPRGRPQRSSRCIPSGLPSPARSANVQPFFRSRPATSPDRYPRAPGPAAPSGRTGPRSAHAPDPAQPRQDQPLAGLVQAGREPESFLKNTWRPWRSPPRCRCWTIGSSARTRRSCKPRPARAGGGGGGGASYRALAAPSRLPILGRCRQGRCPVGDLGDVSSPETATAALSSSNCMKPRRRPAGGGRPPARCPRPACPRRHRADVTSSVPARDRRRLPCDDASSADEKGQGRRANHASDSPPAVNASSSATPK